MEGGSGQLEDAALQVREGGWLADGRLRKHYAATYGHRLAFLETILNM